MSRPHFSSRKLRKLGYEKINQAIFACWKEKGLAADAVQRALTWEKRGEQGGRGRGG